MAWGGKQIISISKPAMNTGRYKVMAVKGTFTNSFLTNKSREYPPGLYLV
jgi:hypothetical protein